MCVSIPGQVVQIHGSQAQVQTAGRLAWYTALAAPEIAVNDYVLTHANLILFVISSEEAATIDMALCQLKNGLAQEEDSDDDTPTE